MTSSLRMENQVLRSCVFFCQISSSSWEWVGQADRPGSSAGEIRSSAHDGGELFCFSRNYLTSGFIRLPKSASLEAWVKKWFKTWPTCAWAHIKGSRLLQLEAIGIIVSSEWATKLVPALALTQVSHHWLLHFFNAEANERWKQRETGRRERGERPDILTHSTLASWQSLSLIASLLSPLTRLK